MRRRRQNRIQHFKRHYWPIYFCTTNLIFDRHVISILAPRYVLHVHVLCSQCFVTKFTPLSFSSISSAFPTWMLKEMSCIESSSGRISGNTLRPALIAGCLFAWFEEHPLAFSYKDNPVLDEISQKNIKYHPFPMRCLKDTPWKVATDEITYLLQSHLQFPHEF